MKSSRLLPAASISRSRRTATVMHSVPLRLERFAHEFVVGVLAGADDQPAGEAVGAELEDVSVVAFVSVASWMRLIQSRSERSAAKCSSRVNIILRLAAADERHDFQAVAVAEQRLGVLRAGTTSRFSSTATCGA